MGTPVLAAGSLGCFGCTSCIACSVFFAGVLIAYLGFIGLLSAGGY